MQNDDWGWYDLKYDLAELILPKLEAYKKGFVEEGMCLPTWLLEEEKETYTDEETKVLNDKWIRELDKMLLAFKQIINFKTGQYNDLSYNKAEIQDGLDSFGKHFQHFWD